MNPYGRHESRRDWSGFSEGRSNPGSALKGNNELVQGQFMISFCPTNRRYAFTLSELLFVIAIIILLVSLAIPGLSKANMACKRMVCSSNLKQIGIGISLYAIDHDNTLPLAVDPAYGDQRAWLGYTIWTYVGYKSSAFNFPDNDLQGNAGLDRNIFQCPVTKHWPKSKIRSIRMTQATYGVGNLCSYAMNNAPSYVYYGTPYTPCRVSQIVNPGVTAIVLEQDENPSNQWLYNGAWGLIPHNGTCNVLFVDGHVSNLAPKDIPTGKDWTDPKLSPFWSGK